MSTKYTDEFREQRFFMVKVYYQIAITVLSAKKTKIARCCARSAECFEVVRKKDKRKFFFVSFFSIYCR